MLPSILLMLHTPVQSVAVIHQLACKQYQKKNVKVKVKAFIYRMTRRHLAGFKTRKYLHMSRDVDAQRAASPGFSCVSMKSNNSMRLPPYLSVIDAQRAASPGLSCVSMKSNNSMMLPPNLSDGPAVVSDPVIISRKRKRAASPISSCVSMKSNNYIHHPPDLSDGPVTSDFVAGRADQIRYVSSQTSTSSYSQNHISHHETEAALQ
ncbi:hypothetical protein cypCar_00048704, partial [Cyprinus carpio]